jgi:hypothetical protein
MEVNMNFERVRETIHLLHRVTDHKLPFDYTGYGHTTPGQSCATVACAAGYMTLHKPFQEQGFRPESLLVLSPCYAGLVGYAALAAFLDIPPMVAKSVFIHLGTYIGKDSRKVTATDVANFLQDLYDAALQPVNVKLEMEV